ncbi:hypothetical protein PF005_g9904 [Phytophthora fragariae]|uniref:GOLD domain-containing protein n=1 Tax=Phytophthora fragariae TaxID=53985 RepID=A0A6A3ZKV3_9STRA|nr:hypothetical protein PF003_g3210 [Phytophthora fragariae]KAE8939171.1 hypothetical protein PF009_g10991 [Phytophthora fragariae]KAE9005214.1 hypothetical protein PF011_g12134 [Phytophthora fragariae]KAE9122598.1 hypothetical protein PF007_g7397 [Phytophthora fragariae]KAE9124017.1 hypothetical protein PF010_g6182 [Phytophthora fragariae]
MTLDVAVKAPLSPAPDAPLDAASLILLHHDGHFRLLERTLRDFQRLERQLQQEPRPHSSAALPSIIPTIEAYCDVKPSFYPPEQQAARLAIALETYLRELAANSQVLASSLALKTFFHGNVLSTHTTAGPSYRDAVEAAIDADEETTDLLQERVAAGCSVEHQVAVNFAGDEDKQLVLWKFASQGTGLVFTAQFSSGDAGSSTDVDPYSVNDIDAGLSVEDERDVVHYRTNCDFSSGGDDEGFIYGHFVTEKTGTVTLQWENLDMCSVASKPLKFQVKVVSMEVGGKVLEIVEGLSAVDTSEWLCNYVSASEVTALEDVVGWEDDESDDGFGDSAYDDNLSGEVPEKDSQIQAAVLEERTHELETQVARLEEGLAATKKELKSALDRVTIAEEIYKANLETITQLECATVGTPAVPKTSRITHKVEDTTAPPAATPSTQPEGTPSSELERVQKLCAGFQEQCLWRSVENMELEAQLAASQIEASSWREKHSEQAAQLQALEQQNLTLRTHKKMLVQEVKRLQPYSQVNLAALVQEAQEARMVQRSLQAKLDSHEQSDNTETAVETDSADFVLVEASE